MRPLLVVPLAAALFAMTGCTRGGAVPASPSALTSPSTAGSPPASASVPTPTSSPSAAPTAAGPVALVIRVDRQGGFIAPVATLASLPTVAAYSDGRILAPAPIAAIYPGPLVAPMTVRNVGPRGAQAIRDAIHAAGLDAPAPSTEPTGPGVPDAGETVFTVDVDGRTVVTRFPSVVADPAPPGSAPAASGRREAAFGLLDRLTNPSETWGATDVTEVAYDAPGYEVFVAPGAPKDPSLTEPSVAWPLATPLQKFGEPATPDRGIAGLREGRIVGADVDAAKRAFGSATSLSPFTSGGAAFTLFVRPLLPDEVSG